jgi:hypothetical protein
LALGVVFPISYAENDFANGKFDSLGQKCNFCSDAPYPTASIASQRTVPQHTYGLKTTKATLDWSNKLYNVKGLGLRKALEAIIVTWVIKSLNKGTMLGAKNLIQTHITRGYNPPNSTATVYR